MRTNHCLLYPACCTRHGSTPRPAVFQSQGALLRVLETCAVALESGANAGSLGHVFAVAWDFRWVRAFAGHVIGACCYFDFTFQVTRSSSLAEYPGEKTSFTTPSGAKKDMLPVTVPPGARSPSPSALGTS